MVIDPSGKHGCFHGHGHGAVRLHRIVQLRSPRKNGAFTKMDSPTASTYSDCFVKISETDERRVVVTSKLLGCLSISK